MAKSLTDLAARMRKEVERLAEIGNASAKQVGFLIVDELAHFTPVDKSEALSNWQVSLDSPVTSKIKPHFVGRFGSTQEASAAATVAQARLILSSKKPGQKIFISNLASYIVELNNGSSRQHPGGFVERAVRVAEASLKRTTIKV